MPRHDACRYCNPGMFIAIFQISRKLVDDTRLPTRYSPLCKFISTERDERVFIVNEYRSALFDSSLVFDHFLWIFIVYTFFSFYFSLRLAMHKRITRNSVSSWMQILHNGFDLLDLDPFFHCYNINNLSSVIITLANSFQT